MKEKKLSNKGQKNKNLRIQSFDIESAYVNIDYKNDFTSMLN